MGFFDKLKDQAKKPEKQKKQEVPKTEKNEPVPEETEFSEEPLQRGGQLTLDIYETDTDFIIQSTVAGVKAEDLDISIDGDLVSIKGSRKRTIEEKHGKYIYQECYWGDFSREIILPEEVDDTKTEATIKNGLFTLKIPKAGKSKKTKVTVKPAPEETEFSEEPLQKGGQLTLDIYETDTDFIIQSTVAGVRAEDLDISIDGDLVSIKGSRKRTIEEKHGKYIYQECYWGDFSREIILPEEVDDTKTEATIKNGLFTLKIPKAGKSKKTKVTVTPVE